MAPEARLYGAGGRAPVPVLEVAVVALVLHQVEAVSADLPARLARDLVLRYALALALGVDLEFELLRYVAKVAQNGPIRQDQRSEAAFAYHASPVGQGPI